MRRLALVMVLASALSVMARAGEIHPTGAVATPTPSPVTADGQNPGTGAAVPGEIQTTEEAALTILLTLISIVP